MTQVLKKIGCLLLVLSMVLAYVPAEAIAFSLPVVKPTLMKTETVIIPAAMDPDQRIRTVETITRRVEYVPLAEEEYLTDPAAAGAVLREAMEKRLPTATVLYEADAALSFEEVVASIREAAMAHTGKPTEGDYIAWQRGSIGAGGSYYPGGTTNQYTIEFTIEYYTTSEQEAWMDTAVTELLSSLDLYGMSDYEKLCAVYDWMCANITYDYANLEDESYDLKYTAYAALHDRTSVCQGYALLLYRLMLEMGIDCRVITGLGNGGAHAWNIIELGELYYNADATWDASWYEAGLDYNFFLRAEDTFEDHVRDTQYTSGEFNAAYPMAEADYVPPVLTEIAGGSFSDNLTWKLTDDGTLTISGNGTMRDYNFIQGTVPPWIWERGRIKTVVIEEGVTNIGREAFDDCENLTSVSIPSTVTRIGSAAFQFCKKLTSVYIADLEAWCKIEFHDNPLGQDANLFLDGKLVTELVIPDSVTTIYDYTFAGCTSLTSVVIPNGVTSIGEAAFNRCTGLVTVEIPDSVMSIGGAAFGGCSSLTGVAIPEGVTGILGGTFRGCTSLTSITIPDSVTSVGQEAFYNCTSLTFNVYDNGKYLGNAQNPYLALIQPVDKQVTSCVIHENTKVVADYAFAYHTYMTSVSIPYGLTRISECAFRGCKGLTDVTIPDSVTHIEWGAFDGCKNLTSVIIGNGVTSIGDSAFGYCSNLLAVTIPDNVTDLGAYTFQECTGLTDVTIGNGLTSIGEYTFQFCTSLKNVTLGKNVTYIGERAFDNCGGLISMTIPGNVTGFGDNVFADCIGLTSVTIENGVTSLGRGMFMRCTSLADVKIPDTVTSIAYSAFSGCICLTNVLIPDSVTTIESDAFSGCSGLTSVVIPNSVTTIEHGAFSGCTSLTSVVIPDSVTSLGEYVFNYCTNLTSAVIGKGVTSISYGLFYDCTNLAVVTLPATLTGIESEAFYGCTNLWHVLYYGTQAQWDMICGAFSEMPNLICHCNCTGEEVTDAVNHVCKICSPGDPTECEHTWDEGVVTLAPGCETFGEKTYTCSKCGESYTEELLPTGHVSTHVENAKEATNCTDGYTGDLVCDACGVVVEYGDVIYATGDHEYVVEVLVERGCEVDGQVLYTCVICGHSDLDIIPATGHDYCGETTQWPTCTEEGLTTYTCSYCGDSYTEVIPAKNHPYGWIINVVEATCVTDGYSGDVICADCGILLSTGEVIPAGGHMFNGWITVIEPTETTEGYEEHTCWVCGMTEGRTIPPRSTYVNTMIFRTDGVAYLYDENGELVQTYTGWLTEIYEIEDDYSINAGGYMTTAPWYFDTYSVTCVIIEDGVAPVSTAHWFDSFGSLTSVTIPESVPTVGYFMFHGCWNLTEIWFQGDAPAFDAYAFGEGGEWMDAVTAYYPAANATWTENVMRDYGRTINWVPYGNEIVASGICGDNLYWELAESGVLTIFGTGDMYNYTEEMLAPWSDYLLEIKELVIADTVTSIGDFAFCNCYYVNDVVIPDSVTVIGDSAFSWCHDLVDVIIGDGVTSIGANAFYRNEKLANVTFGNGLVTIGANAFYYCDKLTRVSLPDSVTTIGRGAFFWCFGLTSVTIGDGAVVIEDEAFSSCGSLVELDLGGTTHINDNAFNNCYNLIILEIPDSVIHIGSYAFSCCSSLIYVTIPDSVTTIGESAFNLCTGLVSVTIGNGLTEISDYLFSRCSSLLHVTIGDAVTRIGYDAFNECYNLSSIVIPESVTSIDTYAFYYCTNLWHVLYKGTEAQWNSIQIGSYNLPLTYAIRHNGCSGEEVTDAANHKCKICDCQHIWDEGVVTEAPGCETAGVMTYTCTLCGATTTEEIAPAGHIEVIVPGYPAGCTTDGLTDGCYCDACGTILKFQNVIPAMGHSFGQWETIIEPTETEEGCERRICLLCGATEERAIPSLGAGEYTKGTLVFRADGIAYLYGADGLVEETFTGWMTGIFGYEIINDQMVFNMPWADSRWNITSVVMEDGVSPLNTDNWFMYCTQLRRVSLGDGLTTIGEDMFFGCSQLVSITIPASVTHIGPFALSDCNNLTEIIFKGDAPSIGAYAFHRAVATAYYPAGNETWTADVKQSYMGDITWIGYWDDSMGDDIPRCQNGHPCLELVTEPTCTEGGYTTYFCTECGDSYIDDYVDALGHMMTDWRMNKNPTCAEEGEEIRVCYRCGHEESRAVEKLEHSYYIVVTQPTCTEGGYTSHICGHCGATYTTDHLDPLGHSWDEGVVTREPTVEVEGEKTYTCYLCGATHIEAIPKKEPVIYDTPEDDTVTIPDNDCFEGGTTVIVEVIEEGELFEQITEVMENVAESYVAYEFTAIKDDVAVQPNGKLTVTFTIPEGYSTNITIYYMTEDGKLEKLDVLVDPETRVITVELECLGMYILVDQDTAPDVLLGDANGDGRVNARDARLLLRYAAGLADEDEIDLAAADYNGDGRVNARDARGVLRYAAGLEG